MSLNIRDSQDAFESGRRAYEKFLQEFEAEFYAPLLLEQLAMEMQSIPEEIVQQVSPESQAVVRELRGGK